MIRHEQSDNFFQRKKNYFRIVHSVKYKKKYFHILDNSMGIFSSKKYKKTYPVIADFRSLIPHKRRAK